VVHYGRVHWHRRSISGEGAPGTGLPKFIKDKFDTSPSFAVRY
jgi:hypothetical protein